MTLSISLPPEIEKRLIDEAARQGVGTSEYVSKLIEDRIQGLHASSSVTGDFDAVLDEFFTANPEPLPSLPADFSREDIYLDHD
jgi:hypothetical protein